MNKGSEKAFFSEPLFFSSLKQGIRRICKRFSGIEHTKKTENHINIPLDTERAYGNKPENMEQ